MFSDRARGWKIVAALLVLYLGGAANHLLGGNRDLSPWAAPGDPDHYSGRSFWLYAEKVKAADPVSRTLTVAPKGFLIRLQTDPEAYPEGVKPDDRIYARYRYDRERGFVLEPGARVTPPRSIAHADLWLVSGPAAALLVWLLLRRFRFTLSMGFSERA